jgi:mono/diheme cytochrome c family protein
MGKELEMKISVRNSLVLIGLVLAGCGSGATAQPNAVTGAAITSVKAIVPVAAFEDGAALYSSNCAGCHGALTASTKIGADATRIQNAIAGNSGGMGSLATLSAADIQAIASALAPASVGAALYQVSCLGCHGGLASTLKAGADSTRIQNAIVSNTGGMGALSPLTTLQVDAVASALAQVSTGAALYATNCAGCHGGISSSTKIGANPGRIQNAITSNTGGMGYLSTLSAADIQALSAVLTAP